MFGLVEAGRHGVVLKFEFDPAVVAGHFQLRIVIQPFPSVEGICDLARQSVGLAHRVVVLSNVSRSMLLQDGWGMARLVVVGSGMGFRFAVFRLRVGQLVRHRGWRCHCLRPLGEFLRSRAVWGHPRRLVVSVGRGYVCWRPLRWGRVIS